MPQQLPLHSEHAVLKAEFMTADGYDVPRHYGDPKKEYWTARNSGALADLSSIGKFIFHGPDRAKFLNGLFTNDAASLAPSQGQATCLLTHKGKMVADLALYNRGDDLVSLQPRALNEPIQTALAKYLPLSDTAIQNVTDEQGALYLVGPHIAPLLHAVLDDPLPSALPAGGYAAAKKNGRTVELFSYHPLKPEGVILICSPDLLKPLWTELAEKGDKLNIMPVGYETLETLRVESGLPLMNRDMTADSYPLEFHLNKAISFTKGCYLGQETTARIQYKAKLNRAFTGILLDGPAEPGGTIEVNGQAAGTVTSTAFSPAMNGYLALGTIAPEYNKKDTPVRVSFQGQTVGGTVRPFLDGETGTPSP